MNVARDDLRGRTPAFERRMVVEVSIVELGEDGAELLLSDPMSTTTPRLESSCRSSSMLTA